MRPDMAKVVTERPRNGSHDDNISTRARVHRHDFDADDNGPSRWNQKHALSQQLSGESKSFSDLLGPLEGYLRKQVGRPWDAVYSEMNATLDKRSLAGIHIWTHVWQFVERHCVLYGRTVWAYGPYGSGGPVTGLYVHPKTRLLCYIPKRRRPRHARPVDADVVRIDRFAELRRLGGIWYRVSYGVKDVYVLPAVYGPGCGSKSGTIVRDGYFKEELVLQRKKQLSRDELRRHGLRNGPVI